VHVIAQDREPVGEQVVSAAVAEHADEGDSPRDGQQQQPEDGHS
jgi:hypothetical protein